MTIRNERGIALLIVLMIVALLTITVTEFTYSVQLDQHRARHALHALQAQLLARSGTNIAEAYLMKDTENKFDAFTEDWWLALQDFCKGIEIDPTMQIACDVEDESGKININRTRPAKNAPPDARNAPDAYVRGAINSIFNKYNVTTGEGAEIQDLLKEYWLQEPPANLGVDRMPDFNSVEDFAAHFNVPTRYLPRLRRVLSALPPKWQPNININTAPKDVVEAVLQNVEGAEDAYADIVEQKPFESTGPLSAIFQGRNVPSPQVVAGLFGIQSRFYRLQASAIANADPTGPPGNGVGQTVSLLVRRTQAARRQTDAGILWTVDPMDWQREGGGRLLYERFKDETEESDDGNDDGLDPLDDAP